MNLILSTTTDAYMTPLDIDALTEAECSYIVGLINKKLKQFLPFGENAGCSARLKSALRNANIDRLYDIAKRTIREWKNTKGFGQTSYRELSLAVKPHGITLPELT